MNKLLKYLGALALTVSTSQVFAQSTNPTSVASMFVAFQPSVQSLIKLTIAISMIVGLYLIISSIHKMAQLGDTGGQRGETIKGPLIMFFCGIALFGLMLSLRTVGETIMMGSGPGNFLMPSGVVGGQSAAAIVAIMWFIRLVGFIAVVRGFLLLNKHGQGHGPGQGELGRGLTHIFGGVMAIHVDKTAKILAATFTPGLTLPI